MTGVASGEATVTYRSAGGEETYAVTVGADIPPETVKNYVYVLNREFYEVKRARLPKYNKYAKWYYGKKKEVGWCSVFTIYCANASGNNPVKKGEVDTVNPPMVQYLREGQVGNQFDGFMVWAALWACQSRLPRHLRGHEQRLPYRAHRLSNGCPRYGRRRVRRHHGGGQYVQQR